MLTPTQAQTVIAAAILRHRTPSSPVAKPGIRSPRPTAPGGTAPHGPPDPARRRLKLTAGASPPRH